MGWLYYSSVLLRLTGLPNTGHGCYQQNLKAPPEFYFWARCWCKLGFRWSRPEQLNLSFKPRNGKSTSASLNYATSVDFFSLFDKMQSMSQWLEIDKCTNIKALTVPSILELVEALNEYTYYYHYLLMFFKPDINKSVVKSNNNGK